MKENQTVAIVGSKICLVPYRPYHVPTYHEWMSDEEVRKLTASEPLTLEQEYEMQRKWAEDSDKCTFIVLEKMPGGVLERSVDTMVGDVNLFFDLDPSTGLRTSQAELEVMIAGKNSRRRGFGRESAALMMLYGAKRLNVNRFTVKIGYENEPSLKLFKNLGFFHESYSEIFKEFTLTLNVDESLLNSLENQYCYEERHFDD